MISIYKASAGSGKTFTLARQYLLLLLGEKTGTDADGNATYRLRRYGRNSHRAILAITFTNKATEEMKRRIIQELALLGGLEPGWTSYGDHADYLQQQLHCTLPELRKAAAEALRYILFDFSRFNVSTIDAFFQTILRTFAREAELTGNYELELDDNFAIAHSVGRLLSDVSRLDSSESTRSPLMGWIIKYMESLAKEGRAFNVFNRQSTLFTTIASLLHDMMSEQFAIHFDAINSYLADPANLSTFITQAESRMAILKEQAKVTAAAALDAADAAGVPLEKIYKKTAVDALRAWASQGWHTTKTGGLPAVISNGAEGDGTSMLSTTVARKYPDAAAAVAEAAGIACRAIQRCYNDTLTLRITLAHTYLLGLLADVLKNLREYRDENNIFFISDTNKLLETIIDDSDVPFVYERVGVMLRHFLIDEFQDTSTLQWRNLRPLIRESLDNDNDNLIIGDVKQCIYRFRNSDPSLLGSTLEREFQGRCDVSGDTVDRNTNWRSTPDVVRFNNTLFSTMAPLMDGAEVYSNVVQQVAPKNLNRHGYVKLTPITGNKESYREETLEIMTAEIKRQIASGYKPSEILVLTRSRANAATVIDHLMGCIANDPQFAGLSIVSDDSLEVGKATAVRLIISVLRYITASDHSSKSNASARRIAAMVNRFDFLMSHGDIDVNDAIDQAVKTIDAPMEMVTDDLEQLNSLSLTALIDKIIGIYITTERLNSQMVFIAAFRDLVSDYCERGEGDIVSFLEWWDATGCRATVASPDNDNALRVMTMHKSKGLEMRCVHIPFANWKCAKDDKLAWFAPPPMEGIDAATTPPMVPLTPSAKMMGTPYEEEYMRMRSEHLVDELNTTYVAFTRAIDELIVQYNPADSAGYLGSYLRQAIAAAADPDCIDSLRAHHAPFLKEGAAELFVDTDVFARAESALSAGAPSSTASEEEEEEEPEPIAPLTVGSPTTAVELKGEKRRALDPTDDIPFEATHDYDRSDIWAKLHLDPDEHAEALDHTTGRGRGLLYHEILSHVYHTADIASATRRAAVRGVIKNEEIDEIARQLSAQLSREEVREWFEGYDRALLERAFILDTSSARPDRVVWTASGNVDVIDYKTGEEDIARHKAQVAGYLALLRRAGVASEPRGYIWYLDTGRIERV